jgi:hypothetical protein
MTASRTKVKGCSGKVEKGVIGGAIAESARGKIKMRKKAGKTSA